MLARGPDRRGVRRISAGQCWATGCRGTSPFPWAGRGDVGEFGVSTPKGSDLGTRVAGTAARSRARRYPIEQDVSPDQRGDGQAYGAESVAYRVAPERTRRLSAHHIDVLPLSRRTRIGNMEPIWPGFHVCSDRGRARGRGRGRGRSSGSQYHDTEIPADRTGLFAEGHPLSPRSLLTQWGSNAAGRVIRGTNHALVEETKRRRYSASDLGRGPRTSLETQGKPAGIPDRPGDEIATGNRPS
jgi:hypothetical protein